LPRCAPVYRWRDISSPTSYRKIVLRKRCEPAPVGPGTTSLLKIRGQKCVIALGRRWWKILEKLCHRLVEKLNHTQTYSALDIPSVSFANSDISHRTIAFGKRELFPVRVGQISTHLPERCHFDPLRRSLPNVASHDGVSGADYNRIPLYSGVRADENEAQAVGCKQGVGRRDRLMISRVQEVHAG
jgi:hypothetical protein